MMLAVRKKGVEFVTDVANLHYLIMLEWCDLGDYIGVYSTRDTFIKGVSEPLHRFLWKQIKGPIPEGYVVDHINHDTKDNRLCNLQLLTHRRNSSKQRGKYHSNYMGVSRHHKQWRAVLKNGVTTYTAMFDDELDAAKAYDYFMVKHNTNHLKDDLNFPGEQPWDEDAFQRKRKSRILLNRKGKYFNVSKSRQRYSARVYHKGKSYCATFDTEYLAAKGSDYLRSSLGRILYKHQLNFPDELVWTKEQFQKYRNSKSGKKANSVV